MFWRKLFNDYQISTISAFRFPHGSKSSVPVFSVLCVEVLPLSNSASSKVSSLYFIGRYHLLSFLLLEHLIRTYVPRDTEAVEVADWQAPGRKSREKARLVKHQELPIRFCFFLLFLKQDWSTTRGFQPGLLNSHLNKLPCVSQVWGHSQLPIYWCSRREI